jgi:indolepyruvate ferredoxin oxidoreductase beta subunit
MGDLPYPKDIIKFLQDRYKTIKQINAAELAQKAGNVKTANVVLLGAVSNLMTMNSAIWGNIIKKSFPEKLIKMNLAAFQIGKTA